MAFVAKLLPNPDVMSTWVTVSDVAKWEGDLPDPLHRLQDLQAVDLGQLPRQVQGEVLRVPVPLGTGNGS